MEILDNDEDEYASFSSLEDDIMELKKRLYHNSYFFIRVVF